MPTANAKPVFWGSDRQQVAQGRIHVQTVSPAAFNRKHDRSPTSFVCLETALSLDAGSWYYACKHPYFTCTAQFEIPPLWALPHR